MTFHTAVTVFVAAWMVNLVQADFTILQYQLMLQLGRLVCCKINVWTQIVIVKNPHQVLNIKRKDRQIQLNLLKKNRWQADVAVISPKGGNSFAQTYWIYLQLIYKIVERKTFVSETLQNTVDSRYLEFQGTHWNTSRYPYLDISELREWGKQWIEQPHLTNECHLTPKVRNIYI